MNGHMHVGAYKSRSTRTIKLAPTTRAIRAALAVSATMLALAGSGVASAQSCTYTLATNTETCSGAFTSIPGASFTPVDDLTLVMADGSSVVPGAVGVIGIDANDPLWTGEVTIISFADILTTGADAIQAYGTDTASVSNYGIVSAIGGNALDIAAVNDVTVVNGGFFSANGSVFGAEAVRAYSQTGGISIENQATGTIAAQASVGAASGILARTVGVDGDLAIVNAGSISAIATQAGYSGSASGIRASASGYYGDTSVVHSGSITVYSAAANAVGIYAGATGDLGDVNITVAATGLIEVESNLSAYGYGDVIGIHAQVDSDSSLNRAGDLTIDFRGSITAESVEGGAFGILATVYGDFGDINITLANTGLIAVSSVESFANGVSAFSNGYDSDVVIDTAGSISVTGSNEGADGIHAITYGDFGDVTVINSGTVAAYSDPQRAIGIRAKAVGAGGEINVSNSGTITAESANYLYAYYAAAVGIQAFSGSTSGAITIDNSGTIEVLAGLGDATGIQAYGDNNYDTTVDNSGSIEVTADVHAIGVRVEAGGDGDSIVHNSGAISATAASYASGVTTNADESGYVGNFGSITASSSGNFATTNGIFSFADLEMSVVQGGDILVRAEGNVSAFARGILMHGVASSDFSSTAGSRIDATASANLFARAAGASVLSLGGHANIRVEGAIAATANSGNGTAYAVGVYAADTLIVDVVTVAGSSISAHASGPIAHAVGIDAHDVNGYLTIDNGGDIDALATGTSGTATGLLGGSSGDVPVIRNSGTITARFVGDGGTAYGVWIESDCGSVSFNNSGEITAETTSTTRDAVGVTLLGGTDACGSTTTQAETTSLSNTGTITADIAVLTGDNNDTIGNTGTIAGAIQTGGGDDILNNGAGGVWSVVGGSDFGSGDDGIFNAGTINLANASIDMGSHVLGNQFGNSGLITVSGGSNWIYMGSPSAFLNNGTIQFQDGAPDDVLTIVGDFGGDGDLNVDISGLNGTSDLLYIDGDVINGSVTTINVNLLGLPEASVTSETIVRVSGDWVVSNFVLGSINYDPANFLTLGFGLSKATPGELLLGITVTGLSDPAAVAVSVAPGVETLMNSQVGTWRQRMVAITPDAKHGVSLWGRLFQSSGSVNPEAQAGDVGEDGNFAFDQRNSGAEVGVDFAISDQFFAGLLLAKSKGSQDLTGSGVGSSEIDGDTYGIYATWVLPSGFYADASYRWMKFDARLNSVAGAVRTKGDADTLNLELGYAWTLEGGLTVEPQFQYTRTTVGSIDALTGPLATFEPGNGNSSRARLGVMLRKTFAGDAGSTVWTPYASISAVREFDGETDFSINDAFSGATSVGGTSALLEAGLNAQIGKVSVFGGVNWQDGGALNSFVGGQVGLRYAW